jgi:Acetyltransferase (GNAT) domain
MVTSPDGYSISILSSLPSLEAVRALWEANQRHPFADYEFYSLVCRTRASTTRPCVVAFYRDDAPVALLVGRVDTVEQRIRIGYATLGALSVRQLRFIAGGYLGELSEHHLAGFMEAIERLMRTDGIPLAVFEGIEEATTPDACICSAFGFCRRSTIEGTARHWLLALPETWEAFLKGRNAKHRYWINRLPRVLDRDFPNRWNIQTHLSIAQAAGFIDAAEAIASTTYHRALDVGFRRNDEYIERVHLDARRDRLRGYVLLIDGSPKAFWYCIVYGDTLHLLATAYDPAFKEYEIGTVLLMQAFKDHCGTGFRLVDFGLGDASYKQRFGSEYVLERPIYVFSNSLEGYGLRCLYGALRGVDRSGRWVIDRLRVTQQFKTFWKKRLGARTRIAES